ncbi:MAG: hypothetical protein O3C57_03945, partial [Verrucomicrobia bacterium]|nr:hypothetical protein [Verrucomicrobiota bacterium]
MASQHSRTSLILVSNDDGISSPGLHAVVKALAPLGDIRVVAPATQQSSMGRSLRAHPHETLHAVDFGWAG